MPPGTYLLPAIFLNPAVVLHYINTYHNYYYPSPPTYPQLTHIYGESIPHPAIPPYFDVHARDDLCWTYTIIMVLAQLFAYLNIIARRDRRRQRRRRQGHHINHGRWSQSSGDNAGDDGGYFDDGGDGGGGGGDGGDGGGGGDSPKLPRSMRRQVRLVSRSPSRGIQANTSLRTNGQGHSTGVNGMKGPRNRNLGGQQGGMGWDGQEDEEAVEDGVESGSISSTSSDEMIAAL